MYLIIGCILAFVFVFFMAFYAFFLLKKKKICKHLNAMSYEEKCDTLEELIRPFGYFYEPSADIFSTQINAPQRAFGYTSLYDRYAARFHMVFDCMPIYFDYAGKTWLVELWKGQYGINTGCEIGIYRAESLVPSILYHTTLFHSVEDSEMLPLSLRLFRDGRPISHLCRRHWWLTIFRMGEFSEPKNLSMQVRITFPDSKMLNAFALGVAKQQKLTVRYFGLQALLSFKECTSCGLSLYRRLIQGISQCQNRLLCRLFLWVTNPFTSNPERLLCLYYFLPPIFRRLLQNNRCGKCCRRSRKKCEKCHQGCSGAFSRKDKSHEKKL
ncbi:MAG: DUF4474 domain-containing protein [Acetatifactor sp.]